MNGISVMACVQSNHSGFRCIYGKEDRIQQKYIAISRQKDQRPETNRIKSDRIKTDSMNNDKMEQTGSGRPVSGKTARRKGHEGYKGGRSGRSSAGRRSTSFVLRTFLLAVIFAGMLAGFQMMTRASSREKEQTYKYFTTVTIGYGEDLSDIVFQYCDSSEYESADAYVREICDINSLPYHKGSVPDLKAGAKIVIPYYSTILK